MIFCFKHYVNIQDSWFFFNLQKEQESFEEQRKPTFTLTGK